MKVLLSALACEPEKGSEPEVGFRAMLAAASRHDVWVLTVPESIPAIRRALEGDVQAPRIRLVPIDFDASGKQADRLTAPQFHLRYDRWQREAAARAIRFDRDVDFDIVHHVTLASYWTRAGVSVLRKPLVWGPIGGGVDPPVRLVRELGTRGTVEALGRIVARPLIALTPSVRRTQRLATVTFVQNPETGRRLHGSGKMKLLSNAFAVQLEPSHYGGQRSTDVLFVGRLLPWKAPILALRSLRHLTHPDAALRFCGEGPEQRRLERLASEWGLRDRVHFEGWLPRRKLLELVATAGVLLHPAVHEEAGLCIAEALALGTPVVALDRGGPPQIVGQWRGTPSALISARGPGATARSMAAAIDRFLGDRAPVATTRIPASTSFRDEILNAYDVAAEVVPNGRRRMIAQSG